MRTFTLRHRAPLVASLLGLGLGSLVAACGPADRAPDRRTLIDSRYTYDPRSLDPAMSTDVPTGQAIAYLFDGLTRFSPAAELEPALAHRWDVTPDGRTYTFHLRRDVTFHDGTPFVARHVVRSWERVLDPRQRAGRAEPLLPILGARELSAGTSTRLTGVTAPNDSTVVVRLAEPLAIFPKLLAMPVAAIVPENPPGDFGERPVGTGPWRFVRWQHDDFMLFARNENYFLGAPAAESLRARIIAEPSTAVAEFQLGNVDVLQVPPTEAAAWEADARRRPLLQSIPALQLVYVAINAQRGPLTDRRVRQAINHAIDTETIIERLIGGRGTRAAGVIPPALGGHDRGRAAYAYDPDRARQLLAEAGHADGIELELWSSVTPLYVRMAETIQGYLNAVGIRTRLVQREAAAARTASRRGETDLFIKDWWADYPDAENFLFPLLHGANFGAAGNVSFYRNARVDQLITQSRRELDDARRNDLYRQADSLAFHDAPMVYLYFYNELYAVQPWIRNFEPPVIFNGQSWRTVSIDSPDAQP